VNERGSFLCERLESAQVVSTIRILGVTATFFLLVWWGAAAGAWGRPVDANMQTVRNLKVSAGTTMGSRPEPQRCRRMGIRMLRLQGVCRWTHIEICLTSPSINKYSDRGRVNMVKVAYSPLRRTHRYTSITFSVCGARLTSALRLGSSYHNAVQLRGWAAGAAADPCGLVHTLYALT
jgi:hypothetical protein